MSKVLILRNPRTTGGTTVHLESWNAILSQLGCDVRELEPAAPSRPWRHLRSLPHVLKGQVVPESVVWAEDDVLQAIADYQPDVILAITSRSMLACLERFPGLVVLDYVDRLSLSYRQRAQSTAGPAKLLYNALASAHESMEASPPNSPIRVSVGRVGAEALGAHWLPVCTARTPTTPTTPWLDRPYDVVFFGSLNYPPNAEALKWLANVPGIDDLTVAVAGRNAGSALEELVLDRGWTMTGQFGDLTELGELARIAVAPLQSAAGFQNKIRDAAMIGLPQVATPAALAGFHQGVPVLEATTPTDFRDAIHTLLSNELMARQLRDRSQHFMIENYTPEAWAPTVARWLALDDAIERAA